MKNKKRKLAAIYTALVLFANLGVEFLLEKFDFGRGKNIDESYSYYNPSYFTLDEEEIFFDNEFDKNESQNTEIYEKGLDLECLLNQFDNVSDETLEYWYEDSCKEYDESNKTFTDDKNNFEEQNPNNKNKRKKS